MAPKSKKGRAGLSNTGNRTDTNGKRKLSSTSSNPILNRSPPSVSRKSQGKSHRRSSGEQGEGSVQQPTADQLRFVRPRLETPSPQQRVSVDPPSSQQSQPLQRLQPYVEEEEEEVSSEEDDEGGGAATDDEEDDNAQPEDHPQGFLQNEGVNMALNDLLNTPGRDAYLKTLSPKPEEGIWFKGVAGEEITAKIAKIIQDKFDGPWYSWSVIPTHIQERYFTQLAHRYTWSPIITPLVRDEFEKVCKNRVKGMVNYVKGTGKRPNWIADELWRQMEDHWETDEAIKKSTNASKNRRSDRGGLGISKHCSGPKSHDAVQEKMEAEEGRAVSLGEVFVKTHTRKDGTFVDEKAKKVHQSYEQKLEATMSEIDASMASDGASITQQLTLEQKNAIFFESTVKDSRGTPYGIGRLSRVHGKGKKPLTTETKSPAIIDLEEKLQDAQLQIQEQAKYNRLMFEYLKIKDPNLPQWLEGNRSQEIEQPDPPTNPTTSCSTPP